MKEKNSFYIFYEQGDMIKVNAMLLKPLPIIWNRDGKFCVIPMAVVQNAVDLLNVYENLSSGKTVNPIVSVMWSQGIPISNLAGRALIGE
jgi:hypothetical protein